MGDGVFGKPIISTGSNIECFPKVQRIERACLALNSKNDDGKDESAFRYVDKLKESCGVGLATLCFIYNATGETLQFVTSKDWYGHIGASPYPFQIANGQWGAFLHVSDDSDTHSVGAVVYRGKDKKSIVCDWMVAWDAYIDGTDNTGSTRSYTEVREKGHFDGTAWDVIHEKMEKFDQLNYCGIGDKENRAGCSSSVSIGGKSCFPIFSAVLTLVDDA